MALIASRRSNRRSRPNSLVRDIPAFGDLYCMEGATRIRRTFRARVSASGIPDVDVKPFFTQLDNGDYPRIIKSIVRVADHRFQIYASIDPTLPLNELLVGIKPSTVWQGEMAVFVLGKRVPYKSNPQSVKEPSITKRLVCSSPGWSRRLTSKDPSQY